MQMMGDAFDGGVGSFFRTLNPAALLDELKIHGGREEIGLTFQILKQRHQLLPGCSCPCRFHNLHCHESLDHADTFGVEHVNVVLRNFLGSDHGGTDNAAQF